MLERRDRAALIAVVCIVFLLALVWWERPDREPRRELASTSHPAMAASVQPDTRASSPPPERSRVAAEQDEAPAKDDRRAKRAARDRLRAKILAAEAARGPRAPRPEPTPDNTEADEPGLKNRMTGREALVAELNRDFMPLADECIEQALARTPALEGMLGVALETIADEELGAVVETVEVPPQNEIDDPELHECLAQTAFTLTLPPPPEGGREAFVLTIPIEPG